MGVKEGVFASGSSLKPYFFGFLIMACSASNLGRYCLVSAFRLWFQIAFLLEFCCLSAFFIRPSPAL